MTKIPLSNREIKPHIEAIRITGTRPDGLPDGVHTGGCWLLPNGTVWKPLTGRPYANATELVPTKEVECLEALSDIPLFQRNWTIEKACGQEWLVRSEAYILGKPPFDDMTDLDKDVAMQVEQSVREMNRRGWELNDPISLGYDKITYHWFIVDLSSAYYSKEHWRANDENHIYQFWSWVGLNNMIKLRVKAYDARMDWWLYDIENRGEYEHVYASFSRPISRIWATLPEGVEFAHNDYANWNEQIPHTWLFCKEPLDAETCRRYELTWGWSPIHPREERIQK